MANAAKQNGKTQDADEITVRHRELQHNFDTAKVAGRLSGDFRAALLRALKQ